MKKLITAASALALAASLAACGSTADPIPQGTTDKAPTKVEKESNKVSTCDAVREAFLTGSKAEIKAALKDLTKDKTADATAREYADYYLDRDKNDADLREMDKGLIQMACS